MNRAIFIAPLVAVLLVAIAVPMVYAESNSKRSNDGFKDGSNAARTDVTFNPACDPNGLHTNDGQHTSTYCNAWTSGYTGTWNSLHSVDQGQTQTQGQLQQQKQAQSGTCIALTCNQIQGGSQGQGQAQGNGQ
jgi:hypothetical protein